MCVFTAAFNNVNRNQICKMLEEKKVQTKLINVINHLYREVEGRVRVNGNESEAFNRHLKQQSSLSLLLSVLVMVSIIKESNNRNRNQQTFIGYWNLKSMYIHCLTYADGKVLVAVGEGKWKKLVA